MPRLAGLLEEAFSDDIRNGVSHADYIIWNDGLRLRNRNGGVVGKRSFQEVADALTKGRAFFHLLQEYNAISVRSFHPAKVIVGRFSANVPMPWTVSWDPDTGAFGIRGSSPGPVTTPAYQRQTNINDRLGGRVMATYSLANAENAREIDEYLAGLGFEPNAVVMDDRQFSALVDDVGRLGLWDDRQPRNSGGTVLVASPWGFRWIAAPPDFDVILPSPLLNVEPEVQGSGGT